MLEKLRIFIDEEGDRYAVREEKLNAFDAEMNRTDRAYSPGVMYRLPDGSEQVISDQKEKEFLDTLAGEGQTAERVYKMFNGHEVDVWTEGELADYETKMRAVRESSKPDSVVLAGAKGFGEGFVQGAENSVKAPIRAVVSLPELGLNVAGGAMNIGDAAARGVAGLFGEELPSERLGDKLYAVANAIGGWKEKHLGYEGSTLETAPAHMLEAAIQSLMLNKAGAVASAGKVVQAAEAADKTGKVARLAQIGKELLKPGFATTVYGFQAFADIDQKAYAAGKGAGVSIALASAGLVTEMLIENLSEIGGLQKVSRQTLGQVRKTLGRIVEQKAFGRLLNIGMEGLTEGAQDFAHDAILKLSDLTEKDWGEIYDDALVSALYGSGSALMGEGLGDLKVIRQKLGARALNKQLAESGAAMDPQTGAITLKSGAVYHPDTQTFDLPNGAVVDGASGQQVTQKGKPTADESAAPPAMSESVRENSLSFLELIRAGDVQMDDVPVGEIAVNDRIKQFKSDADAKTGVVEGQALGGEFQKLPPKPIVLMRFDDGHLEVVTGRHRLDLARRSGEEKIAAVTINESDGWSVEQAKLFDAYDNILDEKGSSEDYVRFFRTTEIPRSEAQAKGMLERSRAQDAFEVAQQAGEDLYAAALEGRNRFGVKEAAAIARQAPRRLGAYAVGVQRAVMTEAIKSRLSAEEIAITTAAMLHAYNVNQQAKGLKQDSLFGDDDTAVQLMALEGKIAANHRRELGGVSRALNKAITEGEKLQLTPGFARQYGITDMADKAQLTAALDTVKGEISKWERYFLDPELSAQVRKEAASKMGIETAVVETAEGALKTVEESQREEAEASPDEPITDMLFNPAPPRGSDFFLGTTDSGESSFQTRLTAPDGSDAGNLYYTAAEGVVTITGAEITGKVGAESLDVFFSSLGDSTVELAPELAGNKTLQFLIRTREVARRADFVIPNTPMSDRETIEILNHLSGKEIVNDETKTPGRISTNQRRKLVSGTAKAKSQANGFTANQHNQAAAKIDLLYKYATLQKESNDKHGDPNIASIKRFASPVTVEQKTDSGITEQERAVAYITVKESIENGHRIYSVELMELKKLEHPEENSPTAERSAVSSSSESGQQAGELTVGELIRAPNSKDTITHPSETVNPSEVELKKLEHSEKDPPADESSSASSSLEPGPQAKRTHSREAHLRPNSEGTVTHPGESVNPSGEPVILGNVKQGGDQGFQVIPGIGRVLDAGAYNNSSESGRTDPKAAAAGNTPGIITHLPMRLCDIVQLYRALTGGKLPHVMKRFGGGLSNAMGYYDGRSHDITLLAGIFGIIDQSDLAVIKNDLIGQGFFRHEASSWVQGATRQEIKEEKARSTDAQNEAARKLADYRVKHGGGDTRAVRVMAHELGHLIDFLPEGTIVARGNLLGHLGALKSYLKHTLIGKNGQVVNHELVNEAKEFITWWRGAKQFEQYFAQPAEMYAELFGAFLVSPGELQARAPKCFQAFSDFLISHKEAYKAYGDAMAILQSNGMDPKIAQFIKSTWSTQAETEIRKLQDDLNANKEGWLERFAFGFLDKMKPIVMYAQKSIKQSESELKKLLEGGAITQADYDAQIAKNKENLLDLRYELKRYTHSDNSGRLMLEQLFGRIDPVLKDAGLGLDDLALYAHLRRVIELRGLATAGGLDPKTAREELNRIITAQGIGKTKALMTAWNLWRATWEQYIIDNPKIRAMLSPEMLAIMARNTHYVTMRHRATTEEIDEINRAREEWNAKNPNTPNPLDLAYLSILGKSKKSNGTGGKIHHLTGSLDLTENPLTATIKTGLSLIQAAEQNALIAQVATLLQENGFNDVAIGRLHNGLILTDESSRFKGQSLNPQQNNRLATLQFRQGGKEMAALVPRVIADAFQKQPMRFGLFGAINRVASSFYTTNNPAFIFTAVERDVMAAVKLLPKLHRSPLAMLPILPFMKIMPSKTLRALNDTGLFLTWTARYIPPHLMRKAPKFLFNQHTIEYWMPFAHRAAKMIHDGAIESELTRAAQLEKQGRKEEAADIRFIADFARKGLEDGIFMNTNQVIRGDYNKSDMDIILRNHGLRFSTETQNKNLTPRQRITQKAIEKAERWQGISEIQEMTVKLCGYMYLHNVNPQNKNRKEIALDTINWSGSPDFAARGYHAVTIEQLTGPFWNARKEGALRTIDAAKDHPRDFWAKQMIYTIAPRIVSFMLAEGLLKKLIKGWFDDDEEKIRQSGIGEFYDYLGWYEKAMGNVSLYLKRAYRCIPMWDFGNGSTAVLTIPIDDESRIVDMAIQASLNSLAQRTGHGTADPTLGFSDLVGELWGQVMPDLEGTSPALSLISNWALPFIAQINPYDAFRGDHSFSPDEFQARYLTPHAAKKATIKTWNASPLSIITRFRENNREGDLIEDEARSLQRFLNTPIIGPMASRWFRVSSGGQEQTINAYDKIEEQTRAVVRLRIKEDLVESLRSGLISERSTRRMNDPSPEGALYASGFLKAWRTHTIDRQSGNTHLWKTTNKMSDDKLRICAEEYLQRHGY